MREARDKARLTLETIAKDPQELSQTLATSLVSTFAFIAPTCPQNYIEDSKLFCNIYLSFYLYNPKNKYLFRISSEWRNSRNP